MGEKIKSKLLSILLSLCMVIGLFPVAIFTASADSSAEHISSAYSSFDASVHSLILSGEASYNVNQIDLVKQSANELAGVFTADKMQMGEDGFSMAAKLYCGYINPGGGGFALVLSKTETACSSGNTVNSLGYIGLSGESIAVMNYINYNSYYTYCQFGQDGSTSGSALKLDFTYSAYRYKDIYVWLDYDASSKNLYFYENTGDSTKPTSPYEIYSVDLSGYSDYYIGITAKSGESYINSQAISLKELYYDASYHSDSLSLDGTVSYETYLGSVTSTTAELRGNAGITGFEYKEGASGSVSSAEATDGAVTLTGLTPDTQYYYRTYTTSAGPSTVYGTWQAFTTPKSFSISVSGGYIGTDPSATNVNVDVWKSVKVTAPTVPGSYFVSWTNDTDGSYVSDKSAYTFTVTSDISLTANYITPSVLSGSGTKDDPYQINNEADLNSLSLRIEHNESGYSSAYYELTNDITMPSLFTPIGSQSHPFRGYFEGNNHSISNILTKTVDHGGLFGYTNGATIKNLVISNATISANLSAGGIVGYNMTSKIVLCTVANSSISSNSSTSGAGGIAGYSKGEIANCTVSGGSGTTINSVYAAGGIVGQTDYATYSKSAMVQDSKAVCDVTGKIYAGGIVGWLSGAGISHCEYSGNVTSTASSYNYAGGIVGRLFDAQDDVDAEIQYCIAFGTATGVGSSGKAGGIAAYSNNSGSTCSIVNCVAMQTQITGGHVNSLIADESNLTSTDNYAGSFLTLTGTTGGIASTSIADADMNSDFWTNLGFSPFNGWELQTSGNQTAAAAEAHRAEAVPVTLTVNGNAVPTYMSMPLTANGDGTYTAYTGMKISLSAAAGYQISQMDVNGTTVTNDPWKFTVTADSTISVTTEQAVNAIWAYRGMYVTGAYSEASTYADIDWTEAVHSYDTPLSGTYTNMNLHLLDDNWVRIGQLTLSGGSVVGGPDNNYVSLAGATANSALSADSLDSDKILSIRDLAVEVKSLTGTGKGGIELSDSDYDNAFLVVNGNAEASYLEIDDSAAVRILGNAAFLNKIDLDGTASLYVTGTLSSTELAMKADATAQILGSVDLSSGTNGAQLSSHAAMKVSGDLKTTSLTMRDQANAQLLSDATISNNVLLNNSAVLDVAGTLSATNGVNIVTKTALLLNAADSSTMPIYQGNSSDLYKRTTLTGLPKNTLMEFAAQNGGTADMTYSLHTDKNGQVVVWMRASGDTVTATTMTPDATVYTGNGAIGTGSISMELPSGMIGVELSADVNTKQIAGNVVSYSNVAAVSRDSSYTCNSSLINATLLDKNGASVDVGSVLSEGEYDLVFTYIDGSKAYGTSTYPIKVVNQYTISFDTNGGATINSIAIVDGNSITLPTASRSGYSLKGWSDGTKTYAAESSYTVTKDVTLTAVWAAVSTGGSGGGSAAASSFSLSGSTAIITVTAETGSDGTALASVSPSQVTSAIAAVQSAARSTGEARMQIQVSGVSAPSGVETILPGSSVRALATGKLDSLTISGPVADMTFEAQALSAIADGASGDVTFTASIVDSRTLSSTADQLIGGRPVYDFSVTSGGSSISDFGGTVVISIPYTPADGEDTNAIVAYYINADGDPELMQNCYYDAELGAVIFTTTHFSTYAVGYNKVNFSDVSDTVWYADAVSYLAARGITSGTSNTTFSPDATLTRGQFITLLMRAYGIEPDEGTIDNFSDAEDTYYTGYLAAAKRLGISKGIGDNKFAPKQAITRQDMFTLLYQTLKAIDQLPEVDSGRMLSNFTDSGSIVAYAQEATSYLVKTGVVSGSNNLLNPKGTTTRAEMAEILYNLLSE